jgi:hemerythrin
MDAQHRYLYSLFDRLEEGDRVVDADGMKVLLDEVSSYLLFHFTSEEHFIRMYAAPDFSSHQTDHQTAGEKVVEFLDDFEQGRLNPVRLKIFLTGWLMEHSATVDEEYARVVRERRSR